MTFYPTIITLTTIPPRFENTLEIVKDFLKTNYTIYLNIPIKYKYFDLNQSQKNIIQQLKQLQKKHKQFILNICQSDLGPITKFYPILELFRPNSEFNLIILDDNYYHLDGIRQIAEKQDKNHDKSFTFYNYAFKDIIVPQGVDIISFWFPNLKFFKDFFEQYKHNQYCLHVDDLLIGKYCKQFGIDIEELPRHWKWVWKPNRPKFEINSLFKKKGKFSRNNSMKLCYQSFTN